MRRDNYCDLSINQVYNAYFYCACATRPHSISGLKSDVAIVFLEPDFLYDTITLNIRGRYRLKLPKMRDLWQNRERVGAILIDPPVNSVLHKGCYVCVSLLVLVNIDQEMRLLVRSDGQTDRCTDANWFYNLSHAICCEM